jgi:hypothetical protein
VKIRVKIRVAQDVVDDFGWSGALNIGAASSDVGWWPRVWRRALCKHHQSVKETLVSIASVRAI